MSSRPTVGPQHGGAIALTRLAGAIDGVIGVDTHRDTLAAAATDPVGGLLAQTSVSADAVGYRRLLDFARAQVPGRRCWAVEGAGSYGARDIRRCFIGRVSPATTHVELGCDCLVSVRGRPRCFAARRPVSVLPPWMRRGLRPA